MGFDQYHEPAHELPTVSHSAALPAGEVRGRTNPPDPGQRG